MSEALTPSKMKVAELTDALTARGIATKGLKKAQLVELLESAIASDKQAQPQATEAAPIAVQSPPAPAASPPAAAAPAAPAASEASSGKVKIAPVSTDLNEAKKRRAEKFGLPPSDDEKKAARAAKFGGVAATEESALKKQKTTPSGIDAEKLKQRSERFGVTTAPAAKAVASPPPTSDAEKAKIAARQAKFGVGAPVSEEEKAKMAARAAKFATAPAADKKVQVKGSDAIVASDAAKKEAEEKEKAAKRAAKFAIPAN